MRQMRIILVMVVLLASLTGCGKEQEVIQENVTQVEDHSVDVDVHVSEIQKPVLGESYIVLLGGSCNYDICYGRGYPCYLTVDSGLPGFGYPLLVRGESFELGETVWLQTGYGEYEYHFLKEETDLEEDDINFGISDETLYLFSEMEGTYYVYEYAGGPVVGA